MPVALITGTSSGLGRHIALHLLGEGWTVYGLSRSESDIRHPNFKEELIDITDYKSFEFINLFNRTFNKWDDGQIDLLINNAAVFKNQNFTEHSMKYIDRIIDTNVKGTMYITHAALPYLGKNSRIIFINSVAGLNELEGQAVYCASKAALTSFAGVLGKELRPRQIKVSSIHPGGIDTPLWNDANPYPPAPSDTSAAMSTQEIVNVIQLILKSDVEFKTIKMFPSIEWH